MSYPATIADPAVGRQRAQHLDGGRLACSVGAEEAEDLPRLDRERDLVDGGQVAVALDQTDHGHRRGCITISLQP